MLSLFLLVYTKATQKNKKPRHDASKKLTLRLGYFYIFDRIWLTLLNTSYRFADKSHRIPIIASLRSA